MEETYGNMELGRQNDTLLEWNKARISHIRAQTAYMISMAKKADRDVYIMWVDICIEEMKKLGSFVEDIGISFIISCLSINSMVLVGYFITKFLLPFLRFFIGIVFTTIAYLVVWMTQDILQFQERLDEMIENIDNLFIETSTKIDTEILRMKWPSIWLLTLFVYLFYTHFRENIYSFIKEQVRNFFVPTEDRRNQLLESPSSSSHRVLRKRRRCL